MSTRLIPLLLNLIKESIADAKAKIEMAIEKRKKDEEKKIKRTKSGWTITGGTISVGYRKDDVSHLPLSYRRKNSANRAIKKARKSDKYSKIKELLQKYYPLTKDLITNYTLYDEPIDNLLFILFS